MRAGEDAHFVLVAHDAHGNACTVGGEGFQMSARPRHGHGGIHDERHMACDLLDCADGTYAGSFRAHKAGACMLSVLLDGQPIGPPTEVPILPAATHAANCSLTVAPSSLTHHAVSSSWADASPHSPHHPQQRGGNSRQSGSRQSDGGAGGGAAPLPRLSLGIGEGAELVLEARDAFGNPTLRGGDTWHLDVSGPALAEHTFHDMGDGTYQLRIACTAVGDYTAAVSHVHPPGGSSSMAGGVAGSAAADCSGSFNSGSAAASGGAPPASARRTDSPLNQLIRASLAPPPTSAPTFHPVLHAPLRLTVVAASLTANCSLHWPAATMITAGNELLLTLHAADRWGNPLSGVGGAVGMLERLRDTSELDQPTEWVTGSLERGANAPASRVVAGVSRTDIGASSEIRLRAYPTRVGYYIPQLTVQGRTFRPPDPDYTILVRPAGAAATRSYAIGAGLQGGFVGRAARFQVVVCDAYGNELRDVASAVRVHVRRRRGLCRTREVGHTWQPLLNPHVPPCCLGPTAWALLLTRLLLRPLPFADPPFLPFHCRGGSQLWPRQRGCGDRGFLHAA